MNQKDNFKLSQQGNAESVLPNSLPQHIEAKIQGEISGQVAVGSHILQIGSVHGGVVNTALSISMEYSEILKAFA